MASKQELIEGVKAHAVENYEQGGWDYIVECYSDDEIVDLIVEAGATTLAKAIEAIGGIVEIFADRRADAIGWGGEDC